jgi:replicative DNA helicase
MNSSAREQYLPGTTMPAPVLPHDEQAEMGVLGSMMVGGAETIQEMQSVLSDASFYVPRHRTVFWALGALMRAGSPADLITLTHQLRTEEMLEAIGGEVFLTELFTLVPTAAMVSYYAEIVREKFLLREMIAIGTEVVRRAYGAMPAGEEGTNPVQELVDLAQKKFTDLALSMSKRGANMQPAADLMPGAYTEVEAIYHSRGKTRGLATGFVGFDRTTGGLRPGQVVTIAGRTSMGKSALAMNIAENVTMDSKVPVLVFSLEMSADELSQRMLLSRSRIPLQKLRDGMLKQTDLPKIKKVSEDLAGAPLYIDDTPGLRLFEFMARARKARVTFNVGLIIIDYAQLMSSGTRRGSENRVLELTEITGGIKMMARELKIPIIQLAQLNREADKRPGGKPRLADLRESGSFEQDSDIVAFIYRAEYYASTEEQKHELEGEAELIVPKHRGGPTVTPDGLPLTFIKEFTRFENRPGEMLYSNNVAHRQGGGEKLKAESGKQEDEDV